MYTGKLKCVIIGLEYIRPQSPQALPCLPPKQTERWHLGRMQTEQVIAFNNYIDQ